jgi:cytochrome o ubiquinol oxidase operon protein cyoD
MSKHHVIVANHEAVDGTLRSYTMGFIYSVVVTIVAFTIVGTHLFTGAMAIVAILVLAVVQLVVQLIFFLHLSRDSSKRWNLIVFAMMVIIVLILVLGTLWIMQNMAYNHSHSSPQQIDKTIIRDEGYKK